MYCRQYQYKPPRLKKLGGDMVYYKMSKFRTGWGNMSYHT